MMLRRKKNAGCTGKRRYTSESNAQSVASARMMHEARRATKGNERVLYLRVYPCRHCKQWHLTSKGEKR